MQWLLVAAQQVKLGFKSHNYLVFFPFSFWNWSGIQISMFEGMYGVPSCVLIKYFSSPSLLYLIYPFKIPTSDTLKSLFSFVTVKSYIKKIWDKGNFIFTKISSSKRWWIGNFIPQGMCTPSKDIELQVSYKINYLYDFPYQFLFTPKKTKKMSISLFISSENFLFVLQNI